jgi:chemotaxis protein MotB
MQNEAEILDFQPLEETQGAAKEDASNAWVVSFADVVTVLLCFFIIFYMVEKQYEKTGRFGSSTGTIMEYKTAMEQPKIQSLIESSKALSDVKVVETNQFLEVQFPAEKFFEKGSTKLSTKGKEMVAKFIAPIKKLKEGVIIQVQGYTDKTPVAWKKERWWKDNMQLSVARSLEVYYLLIEQGVSPNILSVTGYGQNRANDYEADYQRRISFKIEPLL